ncbi:MAG: hypothetical protein U0Q15_09820 [Kineosporiaceae bacterium]
MRFTPAGMRNVALPSLALLALGVALSPSPAATAASGPAATAASGSAVTAASGSAVSAQAGTPSSTGTATATLPEGWRLDAVGRRLHWTPTAPLRVTDARVTLSLDGSPLRTTVGRGGRHVSAVLTRDQVARLQRLIASPSSGGSAFPVAATAAGRRLDTSTRSAGGERTQAPFARPSKAAKGRPTPTTPPSRVLTGNDDPGRRGPLTTRTTEYEAPSVRVTGLGEPVEMRAVVVAPLAESGAAGTPGQRRPLAIFLHGRHESCYASPPSADGSDHSGDWPCPAGWKQVPSYRGYLTSQQTLASQGWITVSVSANGINGQDLGEDDGGAQARSELVRAHLALWAQWSASDAAWATAPEGVRAGPRPDLSRVLLVGHSRGGEGVNRAALDSAVPTDGHPVPWRVRGMMLIAPTAFGRAPAPGVPVVVVLPGCDGDLADLQGQAYLDDARDLGADPALRTAVLVPGANHNFFNTEWTPGLAVAPAVDDAGDGGSSSCSPGRPGRLDAATQRQVGDTVTSAAARALVEQDPTATTLLDGSATAAETTAGVALSVQALGGGRTALLLPSAGGLASASGLAVTPCRTSATDETDVAACRRFDDSGVAPSFVPAEVRGQPSRWASRISWSASGARADLPLTAPSLGSATAVAARVVVPAGAPAQQLDVALVDASGRALPLGRVAPVGLPRLAAQKTSWLPDKDVTQEVRLPVDRAAAAAAGVDLTHLKALRLTSASSSGRLWLLDVWAVPAVASSGSAGLPFTLPRIDVGALRVAEGDSPHPVSLPVTVRAPLGGTTGGRVWFLVRDAEWTSSLVGPLDVPAGASTWSVPVPLDADQVDDVDEQDLLVQAVSLSGVAVGRYVQRITVLDDDPSPAISVTSTSTASEKGTLTWTFSLDGPTDAALSLPVTVVPVPGTETALSVADLDPRWARKVGLDTRKDVPLAQAGWSPRVSLSDTSPTATLTVRLQADSRVEPAETVRMIVAGDTAALQPADDGVWVRGLPDGARLFGMVLDGTG